MKTLIVDDMRFATDALQKIMYTIDPGGEHVALQDAVATLEYLKESPLPDVVFLDIEMPGLNGLALARYIHEHSHGETNVVFATAYAEYALEAHGLFVSGYLLKPTTETAVRRVLDNLRRPVRTRTDGRLRVQCFGDFEVFANGEPVHFGRSKAKELLAYLIDRRGALCTSGDLISILWEDSASIHSPQAQFRSVLAELRRSLAAVGAEDILLRRGNKLAVDCSRLDCDYFAYLQGDSSAANRFRGEYMAQYSWAEMTGAGLEK